MPFVSGFCFQVDEDTTAFWILFRGDKVLTLENYTLPDLDLSKFNTPVRKQYIGQLNGRSCYVAELTRDTVAPEGMAFFRLGQLFGLITDDLFLLIGRAHQIIRWDRTHQFCSCCGAKTEDKKDERAKLCPTCGYISYPRISPAIIVAVLRGNEILLAKGSRFETPFYSVLAGFVEPGETFEECVEREVEEEVGIRVKNIKYFGSQPWPFPDSLMVGFIAEYNGGELKIDEREILDAGWYTAKNLPLVPKTGTIARKLIDWFVQLKG